MMEKGVLIGKKEEVRGFFYKPCLRPILQCISNTESSKTGWNSQNFLRSSYNQPKANGRRNKQEVVIALEERYPLAT
jgi:hypothetical protein